MKKSLWGILALFLCICVVVPAADVQAASKKSQALTAYKKFLASKGSKGGYDFALIYLDNDPVPELIVGPSLYGFKNNTVVKLKDIFSDSGYGYYKKKGVLVRMHTHFNAIERNGLKTWEYSKLSGSTLERKLYKECVYKTDPAGRAKGKKYSYSKYGQKNVEKKISKSSFTSSLKKMVKKQKMTVIKLRSNTAANRNKYLK